MKKLLLGIVGVLSLSACSSNNDDATTTQPSLIGTWKETKVISYDGKTNAVISSTPSGDCEGKSTIAFANNNSFAWHAFEFYNNNCTDIGTENGTYTYSDTTKKLVYKFSDNSTESVDVIKLTATELEYIDEYYDVNNDGVADKHTLLLTRQ